MSEGVTILRLLTERLPVGTTIATAVTNLGQLTAEAAYPAIFIDYGSRTRRRTATGQKQWRYPLEIRYYDKFDAPQDVRSLSELRADAEAAVEQMVLNVEADPDLVDDDGMMHALTVDNFDETVDGIVDDLGFPAFRATLMIDLPGREEPG